MSSTTGSRPRRSLTHRLDSEWANMRRRPDVTDRVRSWSLTDVPFATLDEFMVLIGHRTPGSRAANDLLGRVVGVAHHDPMAARIVLQRILPGLMAIVRTEQRHDPRVDALDVVMGEAWLCIVAYRPDARPTQIAARLLSDTRFRAFTHQRRRRSFREVPFDAGTFDEMVTPETTTAFDELVAAVGESRRYGLGDEHVAVVDDLLRHDTTAGVAAAHHVTTRTIRYRQHRTVGEIRRLVAA